MDSASQSNTDTTKSLITQRTDLGWLVVVTKANQIVLGLLTRLWVQPSHMQQQPCYQSETHSCKCNNSPYRDRWQKANEKRGQIIKRSATAYKEMTIIYQNI